MLDKLRFLRDIRKTFVCDCIKLISTIVARVANINIGRSCPFYSYTHFSEVYPSEQETNYFYFS